MLLAVDIGNSNIKLGIWDGTTWLQQWRLRTDQEVTIDEYVIMLKALLRESHLAGTIDQVVIASGVPPLTTIFEAVSKQFSGRKAIRVDANLDLGIGVCTDNPAEVGADRIANSVAAHFLYRGPSIVIDMGTATTFDVVTAAGEFLGGVIVPGLKLAADALTGRAAQLREVALEAPSQVLGRNTIHAIQSGLIYGYVSLVEGIVSRLLQEHPDYVVAQSSPKVQIIGTGGLINFIAPYTTVIDCIDPWLTLHGLRLIGDRES